MGFHRLTVPSYTGGLPGGYDYVNNAVSGTPAPADNALGGGTYVGSYFFAQSDQVTGAGLNRAAKALADNTDFLDDLLRRDLATPTRTADAVTVSPTTMITITGPGIFLGGPGHPNTVEGLDQLFSIVDGNDNEIIKSNAQVQVASISDTVGNGFSAGNVTLTLTQAIPTATTYRVYYGTRTNLATLPVDAFTQIKIRGAQEVPADLLTTGGAALIGYAGGPNWADATTNPATTVEGQLDKIVSDLGSGTAGAGKISAAAYAGTYAAVTNGSVQSQVEELVDELDVVEGELAQSPDIQVITATNGSVTIPVWAETVEFLVKGGGGGGGGYDPGVSVGGGGGSGQEYRVVLPRSAIAATVAVTIGAGGAGGGSGTSGANGGNTTVSWADTTMRARFGFGGLFTGAGGSGNCGGGGAGFNTPGGAGGAVGEDGVAATGAGGQGMADVLNGGSSAAAGAGGVSSGETLAYGGGGGGGGGLWLSGAPSAVNGTGGKVANAAGGGGGVGYGSGGGGAGYGLDFPVTQYLGVGGAGAAGVVIITSWS